MRKIVPSLALLMATGILMSGDPAPGRYYSPDLLASLDPVNKVRNLCSGKNGAASMRDKLALVAAFAPAAPGARVQLYDDLGKIHFPITTSSPVAQRYFDQGLALAYGFNHAGAIASFREAQRIDPRCALCFWGEALAYGPNINAPMDPATNARAVGLARYADAMIAAAAAHPAHDDVSLLAAEAAMDTRPWDYWMADRKTPQPRLDDGVRLVETVLARNPAHPQASHLYIHLMENGPDPRRAEAAADRLAAPLAPKAGHLVHMPAHIYYRLGRWRDSLRVNLAAAQVDEEWIKASGDRGLMRYGYYPHNIHFIVTSAQMAGDMGTAISHATKLEQMLDPAVSAKIAWVQAIHASPYFAAAQFATPERILAMHAPDPRLPYAAAMHHYARAVARARQRDRAGFDQEMAKLRAIRDGQAVQPMIDQGVPARDLMQLAETVAMARWAYASGRYVQAENLYRQAIAMEDKIPYMEPPFWYYPVHQSLGAALYRQGRYDDAAQAFTQALAQSPNNGWVLYGLAASQRARGYGAEAAAADAAQKRAWAGDPRWLRMDRL